uniref:Uncharacterized protein n=1 Tax=Podarcis muralis TaxID=64176 RepID=A0A670J2K2_PODMU
FPLSVQPTDSSHLQRSGSSELLLRGKRGLAEVANLPRMQQTWEGPVPPPEQFFQLGGANYLPCPGC